MELLNLITIIYFLIGFVIALGYRFTGIPEPVEIGFWLVLIFMWPLVLVILCYLVLEDIFKIKI